MIGSSEQRGQSLWTQRPFALLWTGQTASQLGSQVTLVALPLTAILVLEAAPLQVGLLTATGIATGAIFGLLAGVWVDRARGAEVRVRQVYSLSLRQPPARLLAMICLNMLLSARALILSP